MSALTDLFARPQRLLRDGMGIEYRFDVFSIHDRVHAPDAVYAFATSWGRVLYIGRADDLGDRLVRHERKAEAIHAGATELWVHPDAGPYVDFHVAERRLIRALCPPLNQQHNWLHELAPMPPKLSSLFGLGG